MNGRPPPEIALQRRRLMVMIAINAVCLIAAIGSIVGAQSFHVVWLTPVFIVAVLAGFGAQFWLIAGLMRGGSGDTGAD